MGTFVSAPELHKLDPKETASSEPAPRRTSAGGNWFATGIAGILVLAGAVTFAARAQSGEWASGATELLTWSALGGIAYVVMNALERALACWTRSLERQPDQSPTPFQLDLISELEQLREAIVDLAHAERPSRSTPVNLEHLSSEELRERLESAEELGEIDEVLEARTFLARKLSAADREKLDREVSTWCAGHLERELRAGRAVQVLPALQRAIDELGDREAMTPLREAFPTIKMSAEIAIQAKGGPTGPEPIDPDANGTGVFDPFL
ncbi:hypothetical protein Pan216_52950 [Planctomycetes bacterium Pan216]|uniref:Uncharacterized protein n=1 Tax=Kolteria novifilia TaxID=2527975 RepID=A0A518BBN6_9BACT|nr:hypothetical protein Pan216_52950 [Planctomycetes bacterium Pan216]